jgi:23S rRNA pseudouridine1911/1915/1917 synthase
VLRRVYFYHQQWPVFYEDNHVLALYKPAGLVVQRDYKNKANLLDLAKAWLKVRHAKPGKVFAGLVHRLDGPVAGVMVVARTSKAASRLSAQFRDGGVSKHYRAVVRGRPRAQRGRLVHHLLRRGRLSRVVQNTVAGSQKASLRYRLLDQHQGLSLLEVALETGRRHQIRAQLAAAGFPILGDLRYGSGQPLEYGRIALMAKRLAFDHPTRAERVRVESPTPCQWPWSTGEDRQRAPLWSIEDFEASAAGLPFNSAVAFSA